MKKPKAVKSYSEKLKDPRWQRRRNEILLRDDYTCQLCGSTEDQLHVHHRAYEKGKEPWEYEDGSLVTLCWKCHEDVGRLSKHLTIASSHRDYFLCLSLIGVAICGGDPDGIISIIESLSSNRQKLSAVKILLGV